MHPQYSGKKLYEYRENPYLLISSNENSSELRIHQENLKNMREFALKIGCSQENPATFFLRHIYASQLKHELNQLKQNSQSYEAYKLLQDKELVFNFFAS